MSRTELMHTSKAGIDLIKSSESCHLKAYIDPVGIPTIGWGSTMHQTGKRVKMGDVLTQKEADMLLSWEVALKEVGVNSMLFPYKVSQQQFDALMSFAYNLGLGALAKSTLLKVIKKNPNDPIIAKEFAKWNKGRVNGKLVELRGLTIRRKMESDLYFS